MCKFHELFQLASTMKGNGRIRAHATWHTLWSAIQHNKKEKGKERKRKRERERERKRTREMLYANSENDREENDPSVVLLFLLTKIVLV